MKQSRTAVVLAIIILLGTWGRVAAQGPFQTLRISSLDASAFPDIRVILQVLDTDGEPLLGMTASEIQITENGVPVEFTLEPHDAGVRVLFLIDGGLGLDSLGFTGESRFTEMRTAILDFLSRMGPSDVVGIMIVEGERTNVVSEFSSSPSEIQERLDAYQYSSSEASFAYRSISEMIAMLNGQSDGRQSFLFFFSGGVQTAERDDFRDMSLKLAEPARPTVHAVLFRQDAYRYDEEVIEIADLGGGIYERFTGPEVMGRIYRSIVVWRDQYLVRYRTSDTTSGNREVTASRGSGSVPQSQSYSISLEAPVVILQQPLADAVVIREAGATRAGGSDTGTDYIDVVADVEWPDGHPRKVLRATVVVNNEVQGTTSEPGEGSITIPWDLRSYERSGDNPISMKVQIEDELGFTGSSEPVPLIVSVEASAVSFLPYASVAIALAAIVLVVVFRRQIASAGGPAIQRGLGQIGKIWSDITVPKNRKRPVAYLEVLAGSGAKVGDSFELYGITPIGRSAENAELVFQESFQESRISRLHCEIQDEDGVFYLRDMESEWGTYLNGRKLTALERVELHDGAEIELAKVERGGLRLRFTVAAPAGSPESSADGDDLPLDSAGTRTKRMVRE